MRKLRVFPHRALPFLLLAAAVPSLWADTVTLKSGEKLEGKVLSETEQEVTIEYQVTASIKDTRTVPKAEVASVDKAGADDAAYAAVKNLVPGVASRPEEAYAPIISALESFLTTHAQSEHAGAVKGALEAFKEEQKRVAGGEVKLAGKWLTKEMVEKEKYQIQAQLLYDQMQNQARGGDYVGALNTFDLIEREFKGARVLPDAMEMAKRVAGGLKAQADRQLPILKTQMAERTSGVALLSEPQRSQTIAAQQRDLKTLEARFDAATKGATKLKWPPYLAGYEKSLTTLSKQASDEVKRLETQPIARMRASIQASERALVALSTQDVVGADAALKEATANWAVNEEARRLNTELSALKATAKEKSKEEPTPAPATAAATPAPSATPPKTISTSNVATAPLGTPRPEVEPFFTPVKGVLAVIVLALAFAAWKVYSKIRSKANEIIE